MILICFFEATTKFRFIFQIFNEFEKASGSEISPSKTQILPLGAFRQRPFPIKYSEYCVTNLKIFGMYIDFQKGMHCLENWQKASSLFQKLQFQMPVPGVSWFGRMEMVKCYFLSYLWFICSILSPDNAFIVSMESKIDRYLWYPSRRNFVSRKIAKRLRVNGGLSYPDINLKLEAFRLSLLMRRHGLLEKQSWFRFFDVFYNRLAGLSIRQLNRYNGNVP